MCRRHSKVPFADKVVHVALFAAQRLHHLLVLAPNLLHTGQLI